MDELPAILPEFTPEQGRELAQIAYLLDEMRRLGERGLVSAEVIATVEAEKTPVRVAIERLGTATGALKEAGALATRPHRETDALRVAELARGLAPEKIEGWLLSCDLLIRLGEYDRALAVCVEAARLHDHPGLSERASACKARRRDRERGVAAEKSAILARESADRGEFVPALEAGRRALRLAPEHPAAREIEVRSLAALGRLDEARAANNALRRLRPDQAAEWAVRIAQLGTEASRTKAESPEVHPFVGYDLGADAGRTPVAAHESPMRPSRAAVAAEFLEEHWQKLILALAVLLIVVSSTVGAAMVLGDRLWMAEGKCLLATAYTVLFAAFGRGLGRWGAVRAGHIMRLTTLMVLPVSFALVGELPGLGRSSLASLAVLAVDSAAMMGLIWIVCRSLAMPGGRVVPSALIAMGMLNALTPHSSTPAWGLSALLLACGAFALAAEWLAWWLGAREIDNGPGSGSAFFAFGLLAFYFACAIGRIGGYVLGVPPTLYALPAMLAASAAVRMGDGLASSGGPARTVALVRLGGFGLSAVAFALGLSRPPTRLPLYSGNTFAAAVLGLGMYGRALWRERRPAFLYAGFAALFLAYFGMHEFIKDAFSPVEGRLGHLLGYSGRLPLPFRGLTGLPINAGLALLAIAFRSRWKDARLAMHCHAIGLPLAVSACVLAAFEPLAAVLTMGGYAVAFGLAARLFAAPWMGYLACSAFAGAAIAWSSFLGDLAPGGWSLALATVGLILWMACRVVAIENAPPAYRAPIARSSRVASAAALALAAWAAMDSEGTSWTATSALWMLAGVYILIGLETPRETIAYAVGACAAAASTLTIRTMTTRSFGPDGLDATAPWSAFLGAIYQVVSPWLRRFASRSEGLSGGQSRARAYPIPLSHLGLILSASAAVLAASRLVDRPPDAAGLWLIASVLALVTAAMMAALVGTAALEGLALAAVASGACGSIAAILAVALGRGYTVSPSMLALTCAGVGAVVAGIGDLCRSRGPAWVAALRRPILLVLIIAVVAAWGVGGLGRGDTLSFATTIALTAATLAVATRQAPTRPLPDLAFAAGLAACLVACGATGVRDRDGLPRLGLVVLAYGLGMLAAAELVRRAARGAEPGEARRVFARALPEFVGVSTLSALAMGGTAFRAGDFATLAAILGLSAIVAPWLLRWRREAGLVHVGLVLAWLSTGSIVRWAIGPGAPGVITGWLALISAVDGLLLAFLRVSRPGGRLGPLFAGPLRDVGLPLAAATFALAIAGPAQALDAYPTAVASLLLLGAACLVSAATDRSVVRVYAALLATVAAAYLTMFFLGRGRSGHVSALGVLASLLSIAFWGLERLASRLANGEWRRVFAVPPRDAAILLAVLALPPDWGAPRALLLASAPFLLLIKTLPASGWLYPSLASIVAAATFWAHDRWGAPAMAPLAVDSALACGSVGLALRRWLAKICKAFVLPDGPRYDLPFFHAALALGGATIGLRADAIIRLGDPWSSSPWVPATLSILCLFLLRPYPSRGWVDAFTGLASFAIVASASPTRAVPMAWVVIALAMALLWRMADRAATRALAWVGSAENDLAVPFGQWSSGFLALGTAPLALLVGSAAVAASLGLPLMGATQERAGWWAGLVAILLLRADLDLSRSILGEAGRSLCAHLSVTLGLWWLAVPASPLAARLHADPSISLPLTTAIQGLIATFVALRGARRPAAIYGFVLCLVAIALTGGRVDAVTTACLFGATASSAMLVVAVRRRTLAGLGSVLWALGWLSASILVVRRWSGPGGTAYPSILATGELVAATGLIWAGGRARRLGAGLADALEWVAVGSLTLVVVSVAIASLGTVGAIQAMADLGVMLGVASLCGVLAMRRRSLPLAFAAQTSILLGYAALRAGVDLPAAADTSALLILAAIEMGVAEVAGRGRRLLALPAMAAGLALPLLSVGVAVRGGALGEVTLFTMFAAGTFYAATCGRMRWKSLGYAAAVLYNAALWILWSRLGWKMTDDPQMFFVPVGFSTILFAEANRRALGREYVNAIRGLGLALIYLVLALPIWQTASLGAWAAMLLASLLAVFAGIGLRSQAFLWLGLAAFILDVVYQLGRVGMEHALAKWAIMLAMGLALVLFVALNEKKQFLLTLKKYAEAVRQWE